MALSTQGKLSFIFTFLFSAVISLSGCVAAAITGAAAAGGAGAAYYMGTLKADIQAKPTQIAEATRRAFGVYAIKVEEYRTTELDSIITGHTANDKKIKVTIHRETDLISEISIKVGNFGDESLSNLLYEEIKEQLSHGHSSNVSSYAVPMAAAPAPAPTHNPAPPVLTPAPTTTTSSPPANTPSPSSGTPLAY